MAVGVNVMAPVVVFTVTLPVVNGGTPITVSVLRSKGPPVTLQIPQMVTGVFKLVTVEIGLTTGGEALTVTVIVELVHKAGNLLQIL